MKIELSENNELCVTVSIGISGFPQHGKTMEDIIKTANEALYTAKREGKNKVICNS
jgi:diguanylate cyclase (GGDEF)-like protein